MTLGKRTSTTVTILPLFTLFALPFFLFPSLFYLQPLFLRSRVSSLFSFKTFYLSFPASILFFFRVLVSRLLRVFFFFCFFSSSFLFFFIYQSRLIPLASFVLFFKLYSLRTQRATFSKRQSTNVNARAEDRDVVI